MWNCEEHATLDEGSPLWQEWQDLLVRVAPGFRLFSPEWYAVWQHTGGAERRWTGGLSVLAVRDERHKLRGVLAIGAPRVGPLKVQAYGGYDQPLRVILAAEGDEAEVGRAIGQYVAGSGWKLLQIGPTLRSFPAEGALLEALREEGVFFQQIRSAPQAVCDAPETWDEYRQEVLGGKFYRKINYYERRTEKAGTLQIEHYRQPSTAQTSEMLDALATIEGRSWMASRENAQPRFTGETARRMWSGLIERSLGPRDQLDCWVLRLDGVPVSFCLTLTDAPVRYVLANNFDEAVADHRTGSTLYKYMMQEGIERGIRRFDFGDGEIHYKRQWGAEYTDFCDTVVAWPHWLMGTAARTAAAVRNGVLGKLAACRGRSRAAEPTAAGPPIEQQQECELEATVSAS